MRSIVTAIGIPSGTRSTSLATSNGLNHLEAVIHGNRILRYSSNSTEEVSPVVAVSTGIIVLITLSWKKTLRSELDCNNLLGLSATFL